MGELLKWGFWIGVGLGAVGIAGLFIAMGLERIFEEDND